MLEGESLGTLFLVRHGATEWNLRRPYVLQGRNNDIPLAELGLRQAAAVGEALAQRRVVAVLSSPMKRAMQTAEAIAERHRLAVEPLPAITEIDVGRWEAMDWDRIAAEEPEAHREFHRDEAGFGYPEGENFFQLRDRSVAPLETAVRERLSRYEAGPNSDMADESPVVVVVAHNMINRVALATWLNLPLEFARRIPQSNTGRNVVRVLPEAMKVETINQADHIEHLKATSTPGPVASSRT